MVSLAAGQQSGAAAAAATDWGVNGAAAVQQRRGRNLKNGRLLNKLRHLNGFNKLN